MLDERWSSAEVMKGRTGTSALLAPASGKLGQTGTSARPHSSSLVPRSSFLLLLAACSPDLPPTEPFDPEAPSVRTATAELVVQVRPEDIGEGPAALQPGLRLTLTGRAHDGREAPARVLTGADADAEGWFHFRELPATREQGWYRLLVEHESKAFLTPPPQELQLDFAQRRVLTVALARRRVALHGAVTEGGGALVALHLPRSAPTPGADCEPGPLLGSGVAAPTDGRYQLEAGPTGIAQPVTGDACLLVRRDGHAPSLTWVNVRTDAAELDLPTVVLLPVAPQLVIRGERSVADPAARERAVLGDEYVADRLVSVELRLPHPEAERWFGPAAVGSQLAVAETAGDLPPALADLHFGSRQLLRTEGGRSYLGDVAPSACPRTAGGPTTVHEAWQAGMLPGLPYCLGLAGEGERRVWVWLRDRFGTLVTGTRIVRLAPARERSFQVVVENGNPLQGRVYLQDPAVELRVEAPEALVASREFCLTTTFEEQPGPEPFQEACPALPAPPDGIETPCEALPPDGRLRHPLPSSVVPDPTWRMCSYLRGPEGQLEQRTTILRRLTSPLRVRIVSARPEAPDSWSATPCSLAFRGTCQPLDPHRVNGPIRLRVDAPAELAYAFRLWDDPLRVSDAVWLPFVQDSFIWALSGTDGAKTLRVQVRDRAGRVFESENEIPFILDTTPPRFPEVEIFTDQDGRSCVDPTGTAICQDAGAADCSQCTRDRDICQDLPLSASFLTPNGLVLPPGVQLPVIVNAQAGEFHTATEGLCLHLGTDLDAAWAGNQPICASQWTRLRIPTPAEEDAEIVPMAIPFRLSDRACNRSDPADLRLLIDQQAPTLHEVWPAPDEEDTNPNDAATHSPCFRLAVTLNEDGQEVIWDGRNTPTADVITSRCYRELPADPLPLVRSVSFQLRDEGTRLLRGDVRIRMRIFKTWPHVELERPCSAGWRACGQEPRLGQQTVTPEDHLRFLRQPTVPIVLRCDGDPSNLCGMRQRPTSCGVASFDVSTNTNRATFGSVQLARQMHQDNRPDSLDETCSPDDEPCTNERPADCCSLIGTRGMLAVQLEDAVGNCRIRLLTPDRPLRILRACKQWDPPGTPYSACVGCREDPPCGAGYHCNESGWCSKDE